jgi:hypothetical protein
MKFKLIIAFIFLTFLNVKSQDAGILLNKHGKPVLPETGNFAVGMDVVPIIKYAGNLFYDQKDTTNDLSLYYPLTFFGKYVKSPTKAFRVQVRLGFKSGSSDTLVPKTNSTNPNELVSNEAKRTNTNIVLAGGVEKRKGSQRVTGIYGVEAWTRIATDKTKFTYGNALDVTIQSNSQIISNKAGTQFGFGIRGFLGAEYFIGAKLSLSAEYGWGPSVNVVGRGAIETEVVDGNSTKTQVTETSKSFSFGLDNDMNGGTIALIFYF